MGPRIPPDGPDIRRVFPGPGGFIDHPDRYAAPMRTSRWLLIGAAATATASGVAVARRRRPRPSARTTHTLTVFRPVDHVRANLPEQLQDRDGVEVELREAPAGRGTEIHVRRTGSAVSDDEIRRALRTGRSELEVGYVLEPGVPTTKPTALNRPLRAVTGRGREKGLL
jgi:hypothetical protein